MKKSVRITITALIVAAALLVLPLTVILYVFAAPDSFGKTYYAELPAMYRKLSSAEGKKIVILGTSSVAFGVNSALLEQELSDDGDITVCNFGLYGALGTKLMLELSLDSIGKGDIVLFAPELYAQTLSLYFSPRDTWRAIEGDKGLFMKLSNNDRGAMIGEMTYFAAEKRKYGGDGASGSGVYAKSSFDDNCDLTRFERAYNTMTGGFDPDNTITFDISLFDDAFVAYVNDYCAKVRKRGGEMYYYFAPVNAAAAYYTEDGLFEFCTALEEKLDFRILGDPRESIMEAGWFYDSNYHLNDAGMLCRTAYLAEDLKLLLGRNTPSSITVPEMPALPDCGWVTDGDNTDAACFIVSENGEIVGLTDEGRSRSSLVVPVSIDGVTVTALSAEAFKGNTVIESVTIQQNITRLRDGSFDGCTALKKLVLLQRDPAAVGVAFGLLDGADGCTIVIPRGTFPAYANNYFWGHYAGRIEEAAA